MALTTITKGMADGAETIQANFVEVENMINALPTKVAPTLRNGWTDYGDGFSGAKYFKDSQGVVHITGLINGGSTIAGTILFTLPVGYRPLGKEMFNVNANNTLGRIEVHSNGNVVASLVNVTYTSLSGITFLAEA